MAADDFESRRAARAAWRIRKFALGEEPDEELPASTTDEERMAIAWNLSVETWRLAGRPLPDYDRAHIPARLFRPGEKPPDDDW